MGSGGAGSCHTRGLGNETRASRVSDCMLSVGEVGQRTIVDRMLVCCDGFSLLEDTIVHQ